MGEAVESGGGFYREQVRSRALGGVAFATAGGLLGVVGLIQTGLATPVRLGLVGLLAIAMDGCASMVARRSAGLPQAHWTADDALRAKRMFRAVNIILWVSVVTAVVILMMLAMPQYIVPAVAILLGLALFPLAGTFRYPAHRVTGVLLVAWSLACLALMTRDRVSGVAALGAAVILLVSGGAMVGRTVLVLRR